MRHLKKELWPCKITLNIHDSHFEHRTQIDEILHWLGENLGGFKRQWNVVYWHDRTDFYFRDDQTATFFALRWS